ncbi:hypothetical protein F5888DRAFT_1808270 [Russula emetica]|nr:hypothetical protein F5888DRAFT_1808270 [Russula emetica]
MTATAIYPTPAESWDDDFVLQRAKDISNAPIPDSNDPHWSLSTSQDWRPDSRSMSTLSQLDGQLPTVRLQEWAEPGPSTPPRHAVPHPENWDDDFEDKNSPARQPPSRSHHKPPKLPDIPEPENWDDDLDANKFVSPRKDHAWDSSDDDDGIDEEDKTVTARPRKGPLGKRSPPPPVPSLPLSLESVGETFPGSPTLSVFSIPQSGRESVNTYSSLAHLPLRGGNASARTMLHPSPPAQKGRRRLRKKSRPPDNNVFELLDRRRDIAPLPSPPQPSSPNQAPIDLPPSEASNSSKSSILSRLGSVKRTERDATPRAAASRARSPSRTPSWFFRSSAGTPDSTPGGSPLGSTPLELKHERSFRQLRAFVAAVDSPTKKGKLPGSILGERSRDSGSGSTPDGSPPSSPRRPRRPKSMQVNAIATPSRAPRHASYGARSISRCMSHTSTEDITRETQGGSEEKVKEKDGHRGFMSGVRRISLVPGKKHKRTKSTTTVANDTDERQSPSSIPQTPPPAMPMVMAPSISSQLLPPIELQPPSPPRDQEPDERRRSMASERSIISTSGSLAAGVESLLLQPSVDSRSVSSSPPTITPRPSPSKNPGSPQAASLGRATQPLPVSVATGIVPRRNSLGDLKIPARISQAQVGLKRDLGMVREFAAEVESLKELQSVYQFLAVEAQTILLERGRHHPPRPTSPTFFNLPRPRSRARSNTSPNPSLEPAGPQRQFAAAFFHLDHKYKISWECAGLLIELSGGPPAPVPQAVQHSMQYGDSISGRRSRERAITLAGDEAAPPFPMAFSGSSVTSPPAEWRASTGRNDLSQRQLWLLRDMLNKSDSSPTMLANLQIPEEGTAVSRNWRWGEATSSTITLPSEESGRNLSSAKKRRYSRIGMSGLRDMLRSLTRGQQPTSQPPIPGRPPSSASTSASSTYDDQSVGHSHSQGRTMISSSTGRDPDDTPPPVICASSPFSTSPSLTHKSPRRPSIASIFRFAQKAKPSSPARSVSKPRILHSYSSGSDLGGSSSRSRNGGGTVNGDGDEEYEDEDWDHIDSAKDLDLDVASARALGLKDVNGSAIATVRGRRSKQQHPYQPEKKGTASNASQSSSSSLWAESPSTGSRSQVSLAATATTTATRSPPAATPPLPQTSTVTPSTYLRPTRLSNVEEMAEAQLDNDHVHAHEQASRAESKEKGKSKSPRRTSSRRGRLTGSVRSAPPPTPAPAPLPLQDGDRSLGLSLTPETIRPLLENAREVHARCTECVDELRALLAARLS